VSYFKLELSGLKLVPFGRGFWIYKLRFVGSTIALWELNVENFQFLVLQIRWSLFSKDRQDRNNYLILPLFQNNCPISKYGHWLLHASLAECSSIITYLPKIPKKILDATNVLCPTLQLFLSSLDHDSTKEACMSQCPYLEIGHLFWNGRSIII